jgi:hypothetical protein
VSVFLVEGKSREGCGGHEDRVKKREREEEKRSKGSESDSARQEIKEEGYHSPFRNG